MISNLKIATIALKLAEIAVQDELQRLKPILIEHLKDHQVAPRTPEQINSIILNDDRLTIQWTEGDGWYYLELPCE